MGAMNTNSVDEFEICDVFSTSGDHVCRLRGEVGQAEGLGNLFKALGDETRAKILFCLSRAELCVCDVASVMDMSVQAVSHHLRLLRAMNLVKSRKVGKMVYYALDDEHVEHLISEGLAHVQEHRK